MPLVSLQDIQQAQRVIHGKVHRTPMMTATLLGEMVGLALHLKAELFQKTGSFKVRGNFNKLAHLSDEEKGRGVISISAGNHAAGIAYAASQSGIKSVIVMPRTAPQSKIDATRAYGGEVILDDMITLLARSQQIQQERHLTFVHPFDDLHIIAGHGTAGLEIIEDVPEPDYVIIPIGGGGLISGVSTAIKALSPSTMVIGVEPTGADGMTRSLHDGKAAHLDKVDTIADGLAAPFVGEHNFAHVQQFVDEVVLVTDEEIKDAMRLIMERAKLMAEPAGAAAFAALLHHKVDIPQGAQVVAMVSGGNVNRNLLKELF